MAGIYIHIPFCKQACHYCDFHFSTSLKKKDLLLKAIEKELLLRKDELSGQNIETIYFGGGTPSLLGTSEITSILNSISSNYTVNSDIEITLEANPDDLTQDKIIELSKTPINRLSIGIQSFFEEDLKLMNRAHNADEARRCLKIAKDYFNNISLDLIYGIPGLSHERWKENIEIALSYHIPHISSYALTVEPNTALDMFVKKGIYKDVDDKVSQEQFYMLVDNLEKQGFINYEISNFGKPKFFSKNNTAYWMGKAYLGIGPSAHSYDGAKRSWNIANNSKYIKSINEGIIPNEQEILSRADSYNEYIMTGLRTIWGVSLNNIEEEFGTDKKVQLLQDAQKYMDQGLLKIDESIDNPKLKILSSTKKGKFLIDGIASDLFLLN